MTERKPRMKISAKAVSLLALAVPAIAGAADLGGFSVQGGVDWGVGRFGDGASVQNRTMDTLTLRVVPAYDLSTAITSLPVPLRLGPTFSYAFTGQITDPNAVGGTNVRGSGYKLGVAASSTFGKFDVLAGVNFLANYALSNNNTSGQSQSYSGYVGGVIEASYALTPWLSPVITGEYGGYGSGSTGSGSSASIPSITSWSVGIGVTTRYPFQSESAKKEGDQK